LQIYPAAVDFLVNLMTATPDSPTPNSVPSSENLPTGNSTPRVVWDSQALLSGQREVFIQHGPECYRLILTKSGKLILQK
jgi:hemin uptake protein HemP